MWYIVEWLFYGNRRRHRRRKHHHTKPPAAVHNLTGVVHMSTATLTWTLPSTRSDGSALALADIDFVDIFDMSDADPSDPSIGTVHGPFTGPSATFVTTDLTAGNHSFTVVVQDTGGRRSALSNAATAVITVVVANPAAVTDLAAIVNP